MWSFIHRPLLYRDQQGDKDVTNNKNYKNISGISCIQGVSIFKNIDILIKVFKRQKDSLIIVAILATGYIVITALIMFNVEPKLAVWNSYSSLACRYYYSRVYGRIKPKQKRQ